MSARYLIRLDDACPTMAHVKWQRLESLLDAVGIKPIVAVVPDNQDAELHISPPDSLFWNTVRRWQNKGWTIAMHGYQHQFHPVDRRKLLLPFYDRSEFAGLSYEEQAEKVRHSWRLFQEQGVELSVWVAPAHCFDRVTLDALRAETPIRIVSDGIACEPFFDYGFYWIPQQLWHLLDKKSGVWTVCLHPNSMSDMQFSALATALRGAYAGRVVGVADIDLPERGKGLLDRWTSFWFWQRHRYNAGKQVLKKVLRG